MEKTVNDPRLIVILEADGTTAERAWNRPQNQDRCEPADESVEDISSRESTPAGGQRGSKIRLTFDDKPKNLEKGFVFGSDPPNLRCLPRRARCRIQQSTILHLIQRARRGHIPEYVWEKSTCQLLWRETVFSNPFHLDPLRHLQEYRNHIR